MTLCFIYGLVDPRTNQVRYIGKTNSGLRRPAVHARPWRLCKDRTHKANWIRDLISLGLSYGIRVLEEVPAEMLCVAEMTWITYGLESGWPLTNLTRGGEGLHGMHHSESTKEKIRKANTGRKYPNRSPMTTECKAKIGAANKGKCTEAQRRSLVLGPASLRGTSTSSEQKAHLRSVLGTKILDRTTGVVYSSMIEAALAVGCCRSQIQGVILGKTRHTHGHVFELQK